MNEAILTVWSKHIDSAECKFFWVGWTAQESHAFVWVFSCLRFVHEYLFISLVSVIIWFDKPQTPTCPATLNPPPPISAVSLQPQFGFSSSVAVRMSVTRPVPMVLFPSLRVNLWPFSRTIGWRSVSVKEVSSPGITISWKTENDDF